jgi:hypothetical protein
MRTNSLTPAAANRLAPARGLRLLQACEEGVTWVSPLVTCTQAWEACPRPDWLLWLLDRFGLRDKVQARRFACWCARYTPLPGGGTVGDFLSDPRSREAIEVAERYADGRATEEERAAAWEAASWVATAAWAAGTTEARAAMSAAAWTLAVEEAAERAAESAAAAAGGAEASVRAQADALRSIFGNPFLGEGSAGPRDLVSQEGG